MVVKRIVGVVAPVVIVAGVVVTLGTLKHPTTLSTIEEQKIEKNLKMMEQIEQQTTTEQPSLSLNK
ncbi:CapE family protein [Priestia flexa]|uniref:CapE family protein n=1 Tax=Priestia flexa TaxID=86664 RepID=UPI00240D1345|nr:CapE family protein [Priestia flexa]WEZ07972.1 CapE family protein [Priestia flexa]